MHQLLFLIGYVDMKEKRIPDLLTLFLLCWFFFEDPGGIGRGVVAFLLFFCLYHSLRILFGEVVLGFGDVKLLAVLFYGLKGRYFDFVLFSFLLAGMFSLVLLLLGRKKEESIPLAPFLVLSFLF